MFKPGDIVKVVKKDDGPSSGMSWDNRMDKLIGTEVEIFYVRGTDSQ